MAIQINQASLVIVMSRAEASGIEDGESINVQVSDNGSTKQLVSAAGEGAAAIAIREHLRGHDAHSMEKALTGATAKG